MKPVYIYEIGIKPWEQIETSHDHQYATITVVAANDSDWSSLLRHLLGEVEKLFSSAFYWRTVGHQVEGSRVQDIKLKKSLENSLPAGQSILKKSGNGIYTSLTELSESTRELSVEPLTQPRNSVLAFVRPPKESVSRFFECFSVADKGMSTHELLGVINHVEGVVICRLTSSETEETIQLIGRVEDVDILLPILRNKEVELVERDKAIELVNSL